jgi:putative ATP-dependent endonuclease of the OLD family
VFISRVVIRNFRNFETCDVKLRGGLTCLVGINGAGKSNFIDALRIVLDREASNQRYLSPEDFHRQNGPDQASQVLISLDFSEVHSSKESTRITSEWLLTGGDTARLTYRFLPKPAIRDQIDKGERSQTGLTVDDYQVMITGGNDRDPMDVAWNDKYGETVKDQDLQNFHVVALQALRDVLRDLRQSRISPLQRLVNASGLDAQKQLEILKIISDANALISAMPVIGDIETAIEQSYKRVAGASARQKITIGIADPNFRAFLRSLNVLLTDTSLLEYEMLRNSLGANNLIYVGMIIEVLRRRVDKGSAGELLLVEEPEAHLHPQAQRGIISSLLEEPFQTIVSTHSPLVAEQIGLERVVAFDRDAEGVTRGFLPADALSASQLQDLNRYLDPYRGALLFAERVMLVEGGAEAILIPLLLKNVGIDLDEEHISVIPVNGTHFSSFESLFSEHGLRKKCVSVVDGDKNRIKGSIRATYDDGRDVLGVSAHPYIRRFSNLTTFEIAIAQPASIGVITDVIRVAGLGAAADKIDRLQSKKVDWGIVQLQVLRAAIRIKKARFAHALSKRVLPQGFCPTYIEDAARWLLTA